MNELAGVSSARVTVKKPVFVKHFLQVLHETSNLTVSAEEACLFTSFWRQNVLF